MEMGSQLHAFCHFTPGERAQNDEGTPFLPEEMDRNYSEANYDFKCI
jgi:hypothetical protein